MTTLDDLQGQAQAHIDALRKIHEQMVALQGPDHDESNEVKLEQIEMSIDDVESSVMDLVP